MRRGLWCSILLVLAVAGAACKEEGTVTVHKLSFSGVKAVDESRLKSALATKESSILPWGKKHYFDRVRFDADRKTGRQERTGHNETLHAGARRQVA